MTAADKVACRVRSFIVTCRDRCFPVINSLNKFVAPHVGSCLKKKIKLAGAWK